MDVLAFDLDGVVVRFEAESSAQQKHLRDEGVVGKSGQINDGSENSTERALLNRATTTLRDAAVGARKIVELFASTLASASMDSVSVALGVKLQGEAGFVFVNSKAEASITVTATVKMKQPAVTQNAALP